MTAKSFTPRIPVGLLLRSAVYFIAGAFVVLFAISYPEYIKAEHEHKLVKKEEMLRLSLAGRIVTNDLRQVMADLRTLAGRVVVENYLKTPSVTNRESVERQFRNFAENYRIYDQVRLLDLAGHERIRVNYHDGIAASVADEALQDKAGRYYVRAALTLKPGEIYISPLDLNIEEGVVERPIKPTIRAAILLFDEAARPRAILVVNYLAVNMLSRFRDVVEGTSGEAMFLNAAGYWLFAHDPADEWGFVLDHKTSFAERYPVAWARITRDGTGTIEAPGGTFIYRTLHPDQLGFSTHTDEVWKTVIRLPFGPSYSPLITFQRDPRIVTVVLLLIAVLSVLFAWLYTAWIEKRRAIVESERRLAEAQALAHLGHWEWDICSDTIAWSDEIYRIFGREPRTFVPTYAKFLDSIHEDDRQQLADAVTAALQGDAPYYAVEHRIVWPNGEVRTVFEHGNVVRDKAGTPLRMLGTVQDITERKHAEEALIASEERNRALVEQASDAIFIADIDGRYTDVNGAGCQMLGYAREEILGKTILDLIPATDIERLQQSKVEMLKGNSHVAEWMLRRKEGTYLPVEVSAKILSDGRWQGFVRDITERKRVEAALHEAEAQIKADIKLLEAANEQLALQNRKDVLTGLANRRHLFSYLQDEWRRETRHGRPLSMIMIDIDCFKEYNDNYGHLAGDECLREVAQALQSQVHRPGDLLARYGGEEFVVVLPETTLSGACELAENLRCAVAQLKREHRYSHVASHVTVSVGVSELSSKGRDINELISLADAALYRAKKEGRNQIAIADHNIISDRSRLQ